MIPVQNVFDQIQRKTYRGITQSCKSASEGACTAKANANAKFKIQAQI